MFWVLACIAGLLFGITLGFYYYESSFIIDTWLESEYSLAEKERIAGNYLSIFGIIPAIFIPLIGIYMDHYG